jgi:hypothetical protein
MSLFRAKHRVAISRETLCRVTAASLPWNERLEQRAAASTSKLDRPAACLNSRPKPRTVSTQFSRTNISRTMTSC